MRPLLASLFSYSLIGLALFACATTSSKPAAKPYDQCICGPTLSTDGQARCAIWGESKNPAQAIKVWESDTRPNCEAHDCSQLFSKFCQKIQMSAVPKPQAEAPSTACFCDAVLLENDKGQVQLHCAAWAEGSKNLIEYYSLDDCSPSRCGEAPFTRASKLCNNGFKSFYPPLLNRR